MDNCYLGEVKIFAGNFAPAGWALCEGQLFAIAGSEELFSLIGTTFGGDGEKTFALPDLRGRTPMHRGHELVVGTNGLLKYEAWETTDRNSGASIGYLATSFIISFSGANPKDSREDVTALLSELKMFAFDFAPAGWAPCDGQLMPRDDKTALFSLLGSYFGGNGISNFALPDLRGRMPIHDLGNFGKCTGEEITSALGPSNEARFGFTAINVCIAIEGIFPASAFYGGYVEDPTKPLIGEIRILATNFAPQGWAFCNGQPLGLAQKEVLFSLIGTSYGGYRNLSFDLPDLQRRVPIQCGRGSDLPGHAHGTGEWAVRLRNFEDQPIPPARRSMIILGDWEKIQSHIEMAQGRLLEYKEATAKGWSDLAREALQSLEMSLQKLVERFKQGATISEKLHDLAALSNENTAAWEFTVEKKEPANTVDALSGEAVRSRRALFVALTFVISLEGMPPERPS